MCVRELSFISSHGSSQTVNLFIHALKNHVNPYNQQLNNTATYHGGNCHFRSLGIVCHVSFCKLEFAIFLIYDDDISPPKRPLSEYLYENDILFCFDNKHVKVRGGVRVSFEFSNGKEIPRGTIPSVPHTFGSFVRTYRYDVNPVPTPAVLPGTRRSRFHHIAASARSLTYSTLAVSTTS